MKYIIYLLCSSFSFSLFAKTCEFTWENNPDMVSAKSHLMEQQTHPFSRRRVFSTLDFTNRLSMPISPNSLIISAAFCNSSEFNNLDKSVVLPLPRKPVMIEMGIFSIIKKKLFAGQYSYKIFTHNKDYFKK